jgi:hypothetical protein
VIHAVDGTNLAGFRLANLLGGVARPAYRFRVWRPPYDAARPERLTLSLSLRLSLSLSLRLSLSLSLGLSLTLSLTLNLTLTPNP